MGKEAITGVLTGMCRARKELNREGRLGMLMFGSGESGWKAEAKLK